VFLNVVLRSRKLKLMSSLALTNYQKVKCFNIVFSSPRSDQQNYDIFKTNPTLVKLRWDLIHEESTELFDALDTQDYVEILDAVGDILYVVLGAFDAFGYNFDNHPKTSDGDSLVVKYGLNVISELKTDINTVDRIKLVFEDKKYDSLLEKIRSDYQIQLNTLKDCINSENYDSVINQLVVLNDYLYLWAHLFGFNLDQVFNLIHESNMSKLAETEDIAKETVKWYMDRPEKGYDSPTYRLSEIKDNGADRWIIYNNNTKKALKSIKYNPVDLHTFLKH
jgi:predicted HAD superfamily Cof-like phosphohydrolase